MWKFAEKLVKFFLKNENKNKNFLLIEFLKKFVIFFFKTRYKKKLGTFYTFHSDLLDIVYFKAFIENYFMSFENLRQNSFIEIGKKENLPVNMLS